MKCARCGADLSEGVKFCENCGAQVEKTNIETMPVTPSKKGLTRKAIIAIVTAAVVVFAGLGITVGFTVGGGSARYTQKIEEAQKYVSGGNYEAAINAYDEAIAIKPKREEAYIGKVDIYLIQGDYVKAEKVIEEGEAAAGESGFVEVRTEVEGFKSSDEYLRNSELAKVNEQYNRGDHDGGLISSLPIEKDEKNGPRWIDVSMRDKDRVGTITLRGTRSGKSVNLDKVEINLGESPSGVTLLGAYYDIYTARAKSKLYVCIPFRQIIYPDTSSTGILVYEISGDKLIKTTDGYHLTMLEETLTLLNDEEVARYTFDGAMSDSSAEEYNNGYNAAFREGLDKINDALSSIGLSARFEDTGDGKVDLKGAMFDDARKDCDRRISYIRFGSFMDGENMDAFDTGNMTLLEDYTDLRKRQQQ